MWELSFLNELSIHVFILIPFYGLFIWKKKTEAKGLLFMETSALESTNVESAFLEVLTGEFAFYFKSLNNIQAQLDL